MSFPPSYVSTPEKLLQILNSFAISRSVGTEGEKSAQVTLFSTLKSHNLPSKIENIPYYRFSRFVIHFQEIILFFSLAGSIILLLFSQILISIVLLMIGLGVSWVLKYKNVLENYIKAHHSPLSSKNFVISTPSRKNRETEMKMACVILITPLDSVQYSIPPNLSRIFRKLVFISTCGVIVIQMLQYFIFNRIGNPSLCVVINWISFALLIINLGCICTLLFSAPQNTTFPQTSTAIGPASFLVLQDWMHDSKIDLEWCDLFTLWSGADYLGLWGTEAFFQNQRPILEEYKDIYVIRIESIQPKLRIQWHSYSERRSVSQSVLLEILHHHLLNLPYPMQWHLSHHPAFSFGDYAKYSIPHGESWIFRSEDPIIRSEMKKAPGSLESSLMMDLIVLLYNVILSLDKRIQDKIDAAE